MVQRAFASVGALLVATMKGTKVPQNTLPNNPKMVGGHVQAPTAPPTSPQRMEDSKRHWAILGASKNKY